MPFRSLSVVGLGILTLVFGHVLSASPASAGSTECPASTVFCFYLGHGDYSSVASFTYDTTYVPSGFDSARVSFDRDAAWVSLSALGRLTAGARLVEQFDVVGVPLGTPVSATLVFKLDGSVLQRCGGGGCSLGLRAALVSGADSTSADASLYGPCDDCSKVLATTLALPVTLVAGAPLEAAFTLLYGTTRVTWGMAQATGEYGIAGLPPGVRAIACPGADVTPARRTTWGSVKTVYR